jgi:hypothetical protein
MMVCVLIVLLHVGYDLGPVYKSFVLEWSMSDTVHVFHIGLCVIAVVFQ